MNFRTLQGVSHIILTNSFIKVTNTLVVHSEGLTITDFKAHRHTPSWIPYIHLRLLQPI
jgi:hypothetical protein